MSNPYEAPQDYPRERPATIGSVAKSGRRRNPWWGVFFTVVFDIVGSLIVGMGVGAGLGVLLVVLGYTPEDIAALQNQAQSVGLFFYATTAIGLLVSLVAGFVCVNLTRGVSLAYPIHAGIIVATLGMALSAVMHPDGMAQLLLPQNVLVAAATVAAYLFGGLYAMRRAAVVRAVEAQALLAKCSSPTCTIQFQAGRDTCPVCGTVRT